MRQFSTIFLLTAASTLYMLDQVNATCPRCVQIEQQRAREQAEQGSQPVKYYDDMIKNRHSNEVYQNQISALTDEDTIPSSSTTSRVSPTGSSVNTGIANPSKTTGVSGSTSASTRSSINNDDATIHSESPTFMRGTSSSTSSDRSVNGSRTLRYGQLSVDQEVLDERHSRDPSFSTLFVILESKDFLKTLNGPFTLFIPSNEAFRKLPPGSIQNLLRPENESHLSHLIGNHLVAQKLDLKNTTVGMKTVNGKNLTIRAENDGSITVNGARVLRSENIGSNGVIYIVDTVFMP